MVLRCSFYHSEKGGIKVSCHTSCCIHWPPQRHSCINPRNVSRPYGLHQTGGKENLIRPIFVADAPSDLWHCVCMCVRVVFYRSLTSDSSLSGCWLTIKLRLNISLYFLFFIFSFTAALSLSFSVTAFVCLSVSLSLFQVTAAGTTIRSSSTLGSILSL